MQPTKRFYIIVSTLSILLFVFVPIWWNTTGAERNYIAHDRIKQLHGQLSDSLQNDDKHRWMLKGAYRVVHLEGQEVVSVYDQGGTKLKKHFEGRKTRPDFALDAHGHQEEQEDQWLLQIVQEMQWGQYGQYTIFVREMPANALAQSKNLHVGQYRHAWVDVESFGETSVMVPQYVDMLRNALVERAVPEERVVRRGRTNRVVVSVVDMEPQDAQLVDVDLTPVQQLLDDVAVVEKWTLESQWIHYGRFPAEPVYNSFRLRYEISDTDMSRVTNVNQWRALDSVGWNIVVIRVPERYTPLAIVKGGNGNASQMYVVPKWGGIIVWNDDSENVERAIHELVRYGVVGIGDSHEDHHGIVPVRQWEIDAMIRWWSGVRMLKSAETLVTLSNLVYKMVDIVVSADVSALTSRAIDSARTAQTAAQLGEYLNAMNASSDAMWSAEEAFFHPSMLSLLYFPDSQKMAVYLPLLLPVVVTVFIGLIREYKVMKVKEHTRKQQRQRQQ